MTNVSSILVGNFACAAFFVAFYLTRTMWGQFRSGPLTWNDTKPNRLALSMALFLVGCALFIVAASVSPTIKVISSSTYIVWGAWFVLWVAEMTALSAIGRMLPAMGVCALWTIYVLIVRFSV